MTIPIRFIHISDTHLGPDKDFIQRGANSHQAFQLFLKTVKELQFRPDFIMHTGDVTADCFEDGYKLMASMLTELEIPLYFVTGNHDTSALIKKYLPMQNIEVLSDELNCYRFSFGDHLFFTIDGRGPNEIDPHGVISEEQMELLKKELETGKQITLFIHYPALALDSTWFDKNMLLTNGEEFHKLLASHKEQVRGVFFGHIHRPSQTLQDGILYTSVGSTSCQFILNPGQTEPMFEKDRRGSYTIVTLGKNNLIIKEFSFRNSD